MSFDLRVKALKTPDYPSRTRYNVEHSDYTLVFAVDTTTPGERLTRRLAGNKFIDTEMSYIGVDKDKIKDIISMLPKKCNLNIAGNSVTRLISKGISQEEVNELVYDVLYKISQSITIKRIFSGGQSGADLAGAIAGCRLGIKTRVVMCLGYLYRNEKGQDMTATKEETMKRIEIYLNR